MPGVTWLPLSTRFLANSPLCQLLPVSLNEASSRAVASSITPNNNRLCIRTATPVHRPPQGQQLHTPHRRLQPRRQVEAKQHPRAARRLSHMLASTTRRKRPSSGRVVSYKDVSSSTKEPLVEREQMVSRTRLIQGLMHTVGQATTSMEPFQSLESVIAHMEQGSGLRAVERA